MVSSDILITQVLNGVSIGLSVALVAIGLTLVFGVLDIVNLAHGEFFMMGGYGIFLLYPSIIGNFPAAVLLSAIAVSIIAVIIEELTLRPVRDRDPINTFIITFAWIFVLQGLALELLGGRSKSVTAPIEGSIQFFGISYPSWRVVIIVGALVITAIVYLLLERTRLGILVRASGENIDMARTLGVSSQIIFVAVFAFSAFLAVIAAGFVVPIRGVQPTIGVSILIPAFVAVIIGGLGSVTGTFLAALAVGVLSSLSAIWLPPWTTDIAVFMLLILVLFFRPEGILSDTAVEA